MRPMTRASIILSALAVTAAVGCKKAPPPEAAGPVNVTFTATDYAFQGPDTITAGLTSFRLINQGPSLHHLQMIRLDSGKTFDTLMARIRNPGPPPAWATFIGGPNAGAPGATAQSFLHWEDTGMHGKAPGKPVGGVAGMAAGTHVMVPVRFSAGDYALICFIPDMKDGKTHAAHGMIKQIHIS